MDRMASRWTGDVRPQLRVIEGEGREKTRRSEVLEQFARPDTSHRSSYRTRMDTLEDDLERAADRFAPRRAALVPYCDDAFGVAARFARRDTSQRTSTRQVK